MDILITGSDGQLGNSIRARADRYPDIRFHFTDVDTLDITDKDALSTFVHAQKIGIIINCAAYTAVDKAEEQEDFCRKLNATAPRLIGEVATAAGARVIHVSTDYVFDGKNCRPYQETDATSPMSAYGRTKQEGEEALLSACPNSAILRTAWLYSEYGNNFVKTMLRLSTEREHLNVVFDQVGTPTYAGDLADAILCIATQKADTFHPGIYHFSNEGVCSWYDFAAKTIALAGRHCSVSPIETKDYPTPATRPHYSVLNKTKIKTTYGITIPHWEESLKTLVDKL